MPNPEEVSKISERASYGEEAVREEETAPEPRCVTLTIPTASPERPDSSDRVSEEEFERLLRLAEELQSKVDASENRLYWMRHLMMPAALVLIMFGGYWALNQDHSRIDILTFILINFITAVVSFYYFFIAAQRTILLSLKRDRRALGALVDLIQQVRRTEGDRLLRSPLAKILLQIRLSRFEIGPETSVSILAASELEPSRGLRDTNATVVVSGRAESTGTVAISNEKDAIHAPHTKRDKAVPELSQKALPLKP